MRLLTLTFAAAMMLTPMIASAEPAAPVAAPAPVAAAPVKAVPVKKMTGDTDKDGRVSLAEFTAIQQKRFERIDANKDGFITHEEQMAYKANPQSAKAGDEEEGFFKRMFKKD